MDWLIANWPAIVFTLDQTWKHFQEGYNLIKPLLDRFHQDMVELQPLFRFIETHAGNLVPLLQALGVAFGLLVAAIGAGDRRRDAQSPDPYPDAVSRPSSMTCSSCCEEKDGEEEEDADA